jgi:hypothetical protein
VPNDSPQVGTTWRFVNKGGGPDRRFNNNRQLPILQYGLLAIHSNSGLNELFQCSAPEAPTRFAVEVSSFARNLDSKRASMADGFGSVSFEPPPRRSPLLTSVILGVAMALMAVTAILLFSNMGAPTERPEEVQLQMQSAREQFGKTLSQAIATGRHKNVSVSCEGDALLFKFVNERPKAARADGITPFNKTTFFAEFLMPRTESDLCGLGFKTLRISASGHPATRQSLECGDATVPAHSD